MLPDDFGLSAPRNPIAVSVGIDAGDLRGLYCPPAPGKGVVVFAHGSGSSHRSRRNQYVSERLIRAGFGTLLLDLLTETEDRVYATRFNIPLLAERLEEAIRWVRPGQVPASLPLGLFGASTGAAAALIAAADPSSGIAAVVSRGGRPDLAGQALAEVTAPTLLIVGELDYDVLEMNRHAMIILPMTTTKDLEIVPGATHLFEEPGALEHVAALASEWFIRYLLAPIELS